MNIMKARDVIIGFIFLVILITGVLWIYKSRSQKKLNLPLSTPTVSSKINQAFPNLVVPDGAERADLSSPNGGEGVGVATRQKTNTGYSITVMANLPVPDSGSYQAAATDGNTNIVLGKLNITKSGYLVNFSSYNKVTVNLNGTTVLEGSF